MTTSQHPEHLTFDAQLRRLKESLGVREDQEAAKALGMTKAALSLRKKRGVFPRAKLVSLAASRPDLCIDVAYVVSGIGRMPGRQSAREESALLLLGNIPPDTFVHQEAMIEVAV